MDQSSAAIVTAWAAIVTAAATVAMAIITFGLVRAQIAEAKRSTGLQLFAQLTRDFQDPTMRGLRRAFATKLLSARLYPDQAEKPLTDETVLEFFEHLAHLTREQVLETRIVWNYFSVAVEGYWHAARDFVTDLRHRESDTELYCELEWLAEKFAQLTARRHGRSAPERPSSDKINDYLRSEQTLHPWDSPISATATGTVQQPGSAYPR
ncbi:DUF4760 domain-containing protein [Burkholderia ubonensis]|uniref:DUF4760 domain-containing protein n=1 Tax=Burkholderia ubonensis TaxID=101571 RepID=UPI000F571E5B|nr:hypothetical protein [Burkholderia ubonensis]RQP38369.1 hypothetical protein DF155_08720 [Burkholderia ubonensis]RQP38688.1 hypothetical protein DF154_16495 [Burkholderia ubonensis]RQP42825.1 hypothetical protein DF156_11660 [Burkholderia ubonensis]RQP57239.1 hypothetical protein DF144_09415 [Burkholderia ubonensis]RQP62139.1 hypothetical protein DF159_14090 [Burkholderia ubonensis]